MKHRRNRHSLGNIHFQDSFDLLLFLVVPSSFSMKNDQERGPFEKACIGEQNEACPTRELPRPKSRELSCAKFFIKIIFMNDTKYLYQISLVQMDKINYRSILYVARTYTFAYQILHPILREKAIILTVAPLRDDGAKCLFWRYVLRL